MIARSQRQMLVRGRFTGDADRMCVVELEVDQDRILAQMAPKARGNKSKRSGALSGAVRVKVLQVL